MGIEEFIQKVLSSSDKYLDGTFVTLTGIFQLGLQYELDGKNLYLIDPQNMFNPFMGIPMVFSDKEILYVVVYSEVVLPGDKKVFIIKGKK